MKFINSIYGRKSHKPRLLRYTEHTIINSLQSISCFNYESTQNRQHSNFKLSKDPNLITFENPINHVYRDILNIKLSSSLNQSTTFTYNSIRNLQQTIKPLHNYQSNLWPKISQFHELSRYSICQFLEVNSILSPHLKF